MKPYIKRISLLFIVLFLSLNSVLSNSINKNKGFSLKAFWQKLPFEYLHSGGLTYMYGLTSEIPANVGAFTYSPRFNFVRINPRNYLSVGTHFSLAFYLPSSLPESNTLAYEVPLILNMNIYHGSTSKNFQKAGLFFGGGYALNSIKEQTKDVITNEIELSQVTYGIYTNLGMRFSNSKKSYGFELYSIIGANQVYVFGGRIQINFGLH